MIQVHSEKEEHTLCLDEKLWADNLHGCGMKQPCEATHHIPVPGQSHAS